MTRNKGIFVAWTEVSRRSEELAKQLGAEYYRLKRKDAPTFLAILRLMVNAIITFIKFLRSHPKVIYSFQAHPFITFTAMFYKLLSGCRVIPDLHTAAFSDYDTFPVNFFSFMLWRNCDILLVHNEGLSQALGDRFPSLEGKLFVLEDPIPVLSGSSDQNMLKWKNSGMTAVLISRFSRDEPIEPFLEAAVRHAHIHFYITGNYHRAKFSLEKYREQNITFTGFLPEEEYVSLLRSADFLIVLTTRDRTLLSGGYEGLSLVKPMVVSETDTIRRYFSDSVVYARSTPDAIYKAIVEVAESVDKYTVLAAAKKKNKIREWEEKRQNLLTLLGSAIL
ncbi:MAG: glycosyltransferase [Candidatus Neomarinimicrobiota bacterium]